MTKLLPLTARFITLLIALTAINQNVVLAMQQHVVTDTTKKTIKISDSRSSRPVLYSTVTKSDYISFKPANSNTISGSLTPKSFQIDPVNMLNVKIYPIPVADQINMSYHLNKDSNVTIEIMDMLGVKISTLLSQRLPAGEQKNTFQISSRITTGIYLIRVTVDNQQVIKRISVL